MSMMTWGGGNNYATVPNQANYSIYPTGSVSLWLKTWWLDQWNTFVIISKSDEWRLSASGTAYTAQFSTGTGATLSSLAGVAPIWNGAAQPSFHIVATWDIPNALKLYVNGQLDASKTSGVLAYSASTYPVWICADAKLAGGYWNGAVDDIRIYNRVLSAQEVSTIYSSQSADTIVNGLRSRWLMDGYGQFVVSDNDIGPLRNDAAGVNTPAYIWSMALERKRNY